MPRDLSTHPDALRLQDVPLPPYRSAFDSPGQYYGSAFSEWVETQAWFHWRRDGYRPALIVGFEIAGIEAEEAEDWA